jgi:hypothetical protein
MPVYHELYLNRAISDANPVHALLAPRFAQDLSGRSFRTLEGIRRNSSTAAKFRLGSSRCALRPKPSAFIINGLATTLGGRRQNKTRDQQGQLSRVSYARRTSGRGSGARIVQSKNAPLQTWFRTRAIVITAPARVHHGVTILPHRATISARIAGTRSAFRGGRGSACLHSRAGKIELA